jgi:3-oxoadipyl-CoA thiolase
MKEVVIVEAVRTPIGRYAGALKDVRPDDLAAHIIKAVMQRTGVAGTEVEDVILGCANQAGEDNRNVARMAVLLAGLPETVGGVTVNRLCASSMEAFAQAARAIQTDGGDVFIAGGVESMTRAPFVMGKSEGAFARGDLKMFDTTLGWRFINGKLSKMHYPYSMGETAENVAERYGVAREKQDEFAVASQHNYGKALQEGKFKDEIVPVEIPQRKGDPIVFGEDEHPRPNTTVDDLKKLKPAFREGGTVTAGNAAGINDGASALMLMSADKCKQLGLKPLARYVSSAVAGVDPAIMGIGPVPATEKALKRANLTIGDIDLVEINEAFAAQVLACMTLLGIEAGKVNVNGGGIALGHPLGMSGGRIISTLIWELRRRKARYGLATMCIGVGQGMATIVERLD